MKVGESLIKKELEPPSMHFTVNNDQKLGEGVQALFAAVALTCGLQECQNFMKHLGVFSRDIATL